MFKKGHTLNKGKQNPNFRHGMWETRFYRIWNLIEPRCKNIFYKNYGGRGIKLCERWKKFENFRDDMYESYLEHCKKFGEKNTTIDRIDNNGNYEPNNCRWATVKEQSINKRSTIICKYNGKTMCASDWDKELGLKKGTVRARIKAYGWSIKKALTTPSKSVPRSS